MPPDNSDCTSDLSQWYHCATNKNIPDTVLSQAWDVAKCVSFVFHHRSMGGEVKSNIVEENENKSEKKGKKHRVCDDDENDDDEDYNIDDEKDEDYIC